MRNWEILLILGVVLIAGCVGTPSETPPLGPAIEVYRTNVTVATGNDALQILNQNFNSIIDNTKLYIKNPQSQYRGALTQRCIENATFLNQYAQVRNLPNTTGGIYWGGYGVGGSKTGYGITVPLVVQGDDWKYENSQVLVSKIVCKNPSEQVAINDVTDKAVTCSSGTIEKWETSKYLGYIVDENGIVYLAGSYCVI
jgi:hypothetical protein